MLRIGLDIDGVVYDWHNSLYVHYRSLEGFNGSFSEFWIDFIPTLPKEKLEYLITLDHLYETSGIAPSVALSLDRLASIGDIYYITARGAQLSRLTDRFFRKSKLPDFDNITYTDDKVQAAKLYELDYFVDDFPKYVEPMLGVCNSYLMARPWNRDYQDKLPTITSLDDLYAIIVKAN